MKQQIKAQKTVMQTCAPNNKNVITQHTIRLLVIFGHLNLILSYLIKTQVSKIEFCTFLNTMMGANSHYKLVIIRGSFIHPTFSAERGTI